MVRRLGPARRLAHIWLNEGFATYAEWLWLEREGLSTSQAEFDRLYANADTLYAGSEPPFWTVLVGDPGPETALLFHPAVYQRGAMTLHALRQVVGDTAFSQVVEEWATSRAGEAVTTEEFVALAEELSGRQLDDLFEAWLYTPERPPLG